MKFKPSTGLSKQSANLMAPALSELPEDDEEEQSAGVTGSSPSTTDYDKQPSESSSFSLARAETLMICYSKVLVLLVIAIFAAAIGTVTYYLVYNQEDSEYHAKFHSIAVEIEEFAQLKTIHVFDNLETLGASVTSEAANTNMEWPFVEIADFQVKGILSNEATGAHTLSLNPIVYPEDLEAYSSFTVEHQGWMEEAHYYDKEVHHELYVLDYYNTTQDEHDPSERWNETGIVPYVWTTKNGLNDNTGVRKPVSQSLFYTPIWQRAPPCDFLPQINMDLRSDPVFTRFIDGMIAMDHPVISEIVDATYLDTNYEHRFDPSEQAEPHSYLLEPVYDSLVENRTMVAFLSAFVRWGVFFSDVLPEHERGIYVVLQNDCGQEFTYEIFGHEAVFIGEGNHHDTHWDEGGSFVEEFEFAPFTSLEKGSEHRFCHYKAMIYPSGEWRATFFTSQPATYALGIVACFLVTSIFFLLYDALVQKRQDKVMESAKRSNAIVSSLFPDNVRDRLLQETANKADKEDPDKRGSWSDPSGAFANGDVKKKAHLGSESIFGSKPIADLFPATTIMFCDMVGFTAWSSVREPAQVFSLLETVYHSFDTIAKRRRVFKVETIGDCYVAVAGLPMPRKEHAIVMSKFANDCLFKMNDLVRQLESSLGPDTGELDVRIGLHSGPVTAGVLRGDKGRFQLFGDTMNTASRIESTGSPGRIHISRDTAEILVASGKEKWVTQREDEVFAKGKGTLQTYWLKILAESHHTGSNMTSMSGSSYTSQEALARKQALVLGPTPEQSCHPIPNMDEEETSFSLLSKKKQRLVSWNVDILAKILCQIMARRASLDKPVKKIAKLSYLQRRNTGDSLLDEVKDVLALPQFDAKTFKNHVDPDSIVITDQVVEQLTDLLARVAGLYHDNPFHSFEHASHVTMSVTKLLSRIVNPNEISAREGASNDQLAANLHDHTFGITSDPLTQFACIVSALIHDADHPGVPNTTLVNEDDPMAVKYNNKSVAEQNSVDLAWDIITDPEYKELQACIYGDKDELARFRSIIVNVVMATDIMDKDLGAQRKARWETAFTQTDTEAEEEAKTKTINRKATIVLEHLMQASDVSHTMQHWVVFQKWNERLFQEMYQAYTDGRSERDPSEGWYQGELGFFDYYIIPLAKKLETCGVFGVSSQEYLNYAQNNRREWEAKGEQLVKDYLWRFHNDATTDMNGSHRRPPRRTFSDGDV